MSRRSATARSAVLSLSVLCALLAAGCGLGIGPAPSAIHLAVTRDFGASALSHSGPLKIVGQETDMGLLERNYTVSTRYGGGFVQSIDGLAGGQEAGRPVDWFYYVNGVQASKGAAATNVNPGDHIWWDRHDWSQTDDVPAVVGSFPEPFLNGLDGKRLPVRVECTNVPGFACQTVTRRLRDFGVPAAITQAGSGGAPETLRLLVGPWVDVGGDLDAASIASGPRSSGVYARPSKTGHALALLNEQGQTARTLGAGAGLLAATRSEEDAPVWVITGTDEAGVNRAAGAFNQRTLASHFAVAVTPQGQALPIPVDESQP
jgi:hypothetical protein